MTREELITIGEHKVRRNESLMLFYLQEFEKLFGRKPSCAGCTFKNDWKRFTSNNKKPLNIFKMETKKTFELNRNQKHIIHTYKVGKKPFRTYGNKMTEEFANSYLTKGTKEQIEQRKKHFKTLPQTELKETILVDGKEVLLSDATGKQMVAYAKENNIDFGEATKVADKRAVIAQTL